MSCKLTASLWCWSLLLFTSSLLHAQCEISLSGPAGHGLDAFGQAVALQADRLFVGAPGVDDDAGAVYLFEADPEGGWAVKQTLLAADGESDDLFGRSLALSGDRLAVGAPLAGSGAERFGAVYVFHYDGETWREEQKLQPHDAAFDDSFGAAVAIDGTLIAVGSPEHDDAGPAAGSTYLFRFDGTTWTEEAELIAPDGEAGDALGTAVAVRGDLVVSGAPGDDDLGESAGALHLFRFDGTTWAHEAKLVASTGAALDCLGSALDTTGGLIIAGAYGADPTGDWSGTAYLFEQDQGAWAETLELRPHDPTGDQLFGWAVALTGDTAVVGAPGDTEGGHRAGAAYRWNRDGSTWREDQKLVSGSGTANDLLGAAVATDGLQVLAGSPQADGQTAASGAASLFDRARWSNYGTGWPGTDGIPGLDADAPPITGTTIRIGVGNSLGLTTSGVLFAGTSTASISGGLGGTLLVSPLVTAPIVIPASGLTIEAEVPIDLEGLTVTMQVLEVDPGASAGVSFTPGLALRICGW